MLRRAGCLLAAGLMLALWSSTALALTEEIEVTPDWLAAQPEGGKEFTIETAERDGLVTFTVARMVFDDRYRIGLLEVRVANELAAECLLKPEKKPRLIKYSMKLSPKSIDESVFEFSEYALARGGDEEIGLPGGTIYRMRLADFYKP